MKYLIHLFIAVFFIGIIISPPIISAEESITWVEENFPPIWILEGPDKGMGLLDGLISIYENNLPEYEHHHLTANMARILSMMKEGQNVCHAGILKSPGRADFIYFSIPNAITNVHGIVVKKSRMNLLFGNAEAVSLEELIKNTNLKLGVSQSNSYGTTIDNILEKYKQNSTILFRSGRDIHQSLFRMLKEERIDYMIGYPWEISYIADQLGFNNEIAVIGIQEVVAQQWIVSYIGCTKNDWGHHVIDKLNNILLKARTSDEYFFHMFRWQPDNIRLEAQKAYKERVLNVTK